MNTSTKMSSRSNSRNLGETYTALPPIENRVGKRGEDVCQVCKRVVSADQNGLCCDLCDGWFHAGCEKVTVEKYRMIQKVEDIAWFCKGCARENSKV